jgi:hypothetical protein
VIKNNHCGYRKAYRVELLKNYFMAKNHQADISNPNKRTSGTNSTYDKNQGNRGTQMNPNSQGKKK